MNAHILMQTHAENYLNERRRLGFGLRSPGLFSDEFRPFL